MACLLVIEATGLEMWARSLPFGSTAHHTPSTDHLTRSTPHENHAPSHVNNTFKAATTAIASRRTHHLRHLSLPRCPHCKHRHSGRKFHAPLPPPKAVCSSTRLDRVAGCRSAWMDPAIESHAVGAGAERARRRRSDLEQENYRCRCYVHWLCSARQRSGRVDIW